MNNTQLFTGRGESFTVDPGYVKIELTHIPDFFRRLARMTGVQVYSAGDVIKTKYAGRADNCRGAAAIGCTVQLTTVNELTARPFLYPPSGAGDVADIGGKAPLFVNHDKDRAFGE